MVQKSTEMIIKTNSPDQLRECLSELKRIGYTQVENHAVGPDWRTGKNFIKVERMIGIWAYCTESYAELEGYSILTTLDK